MSRLGHSPREINVFKNRDVAKTTQPFEYRSPDENPLVAVEPAQPPRTPAADNTGEPQNERTALEPPGETAAYDGWIAKGIFNLTERVGPDPGVGMEEKKDFAPRAPGAQIHLKRPLALRTVTDPSPAGFCQFNCAIPAAPVHNQNFVAKRQRTGAVQDATAPSAALSAAPASWIAVALYRFPTPRMDQANL